MLLAYLIKKFKQPLLWLYLLTLCYLSWVAVDFYYGPIAATAALLVTFSKILNPLLLVGSFVGARYILEWDIWLSILPLVPAAIGGLWWVYKKLDKYLRLRAYRSKN